ncbi:hypothetical protein [Nostoc sp. FACHB-133]|uniref:hypothetical protein n=1 Tax=Nostoc sp. FACHB-133 TaxID=2692835 RepID=UPI0016892AA3|nr:hypothetical protein [Nostoc sp. FACHB-133]MBD2521380.1 hypothetical protein [Nostoc sp. FACHB-133]
MMRSLLLACARISLLADARIKDPISGQLFYNQNGNTPSFGSSSLFATLTGAPTLTTFDFVLQA